MKAAAKGDVRGTPVAVWSGASFILFPPDIEYITFAEPALATCGSATSGQEGDINYGGGKN